MVACYPNTKDTEVGSRQKSSMATYQVLVSLGYRRFCFSKSITSQIHQQWFVREGPGETAVVWSVSFEGGQGGLPGGSDT